MAELTEDAETIRSLLLSSEESEQNQGLHRLEVADDPHLWDEVVGGLHQEAHPDCELPPGRCLEMPYGTTSSGVLRAYFAHPAADYSEVMLFCLESSPLTTLEGIRGLKSLRTLDIGGCYSLKNVDALASPSAELGNLTELVMWGCNGLEDLSGLVPLTSLRKLNMSGAGPVSGSLVSDLSFLRALSHLEELTVSDCPGTTDLSVLGNLPNLKHLDLNHLQGTDVDALAPLSGLTRLGLASSSALTHVDGLAGLHNLTHLDLNECSGLKSVNGLVDLPALESLNLSWCEALPSTLQPGELGTREAVAEFQGLIRQQM